MLTTEFLCHGVGTLRSRFISLSSSFSKKKCSIHQCSHKKHITALSQAIGKFQFKKFLRTQEGVLNFPSFRHFEK